MRDRIKIWAGVLAVLALLLGPVLVFNWPPAKAEVASTLGTVFDIGVASGADVFTASLTVQQDSGALRITAALDGTDSTLLCRVTKISSGVSFNLPLDNNSVLAAGTNNVFTFVVGCHSDYTYNFRVGTTTRIAYLVVDEAREGAP